jgi:gliding motility-associated-like protein
MAIRVGGMLIALVLLATAAQAQEICNNGLDDDNDGYVDCFDSDCSGNFFCSGNYFGGAVPACQFSPPPAPPFQMTLLWATDSVALPMDARRTPVVGDIDLDGVPEVITGQGGVANHMYVFNGANGVLERTIAALPFSIGTNAFAIGDIDNDGFGEILVVAQNTVGRQLYCYEHNGSLKWSSSVPVGYSATDDTWVPAIADFDETGIAQIYLGNQIYNSINGNLITSTGSAGARGANAGSPSEPLSVAADVLPDAFCPSCNGLELIAGNTVYTVDIGTGTMTSIVSITGFPDGMTSLADVDRDGDLDGVVVGQNSGGRGVVYVWDLQTSVQIGSTYQIDASSLSAGNAVSGGQALVGDFNNDGFPEIGVVGNGVFVALRYNSGTNSLVEMWSASIIENSERTAATLFDFEGDGNMEIVIRDEQMLRILNAANGVQRFATTCPSQTRMEVPVVADVDNDGQANIVCHCANSVKAFKPGSIPWTPARPIWNQRSYFNVNIKDNLRIPQQQQPQERGFPIASPTNFPYNAFLKQTPRLASNGALTFPAANDNITLLSPVADVDLGRCQDGVNDSVGLRLTLGNTGSTAMPASTKLSFYNGNPYAPGAIRLRTYTIGVAVPQSTTHTLPFLYVPDQGGTFDLYYQINDDGTFPIPIPGPAVTHPECNAGNNMGFVTITNCGNTAPRVDTLGLQTDTIVYTSNEDATRTVCIHALDNEFNAYDITAVIGSVGLGTVTGLNDGDSCFLLTPIPDTTGQCIFSIVICDNGNVSLCDTTVFIWNIVQGNDAPIALNDPVSTLEDTPFDIFPLTNDNDPENNPLAITILQGPVNGTATAFASSIHYTPNPNFFGQDSITYQICDNYLPPGCDTAVIYINVVSVNDIPTALNDSATMPNDTTTVTVLVQTNDSDIEPGPLTTTILCPPTQGTAIVSGTNIIYTPDSTYLGADSLCYSVCDLGAPTGCDTAWVYYDIFNGNEPPIALDDLDTTTLQDTVVISIYPNDSDPNGHAFSATGFVCGPYHGTATLNATTGEITYVPGFAYLGGDTICYVICDVPPAGPAFCDTAIVYIQINSDNDAPIAQKDTMTVAFNTSGTLDIMPNDSDPDGDSIFPALIQFPANGIVLLANGLVTYTPNNTFHGLDTFMYRLCDNGLPSLCDTATICFTVLPPNQIDVPNGFSPNGDGVNDILEIFAIQVFPDNELIIFNRWGSTVFTAKGYNNEWDGTFNGEPLPDGTYFYKLDPGDGTEPLTGFIVLYR